MAPILATDADVVMIMLGANDVADVRADLDIQADYLNIINQVLADGKNVFLVPCVYMNRTVDLGAENTQIDTLNAWLQGIADTTAGVAISPVCTEFNVGVMSDPAGTLGGNYPGWTGDGIHPTNKGGNAIGRCVAPALDLAYPSAMVITTNLIPPFTGDDGSVPFGNGTAPTGWKGFNGKLWETDINLGDGKNYWKITTNGSGTITNSNHKAIATLLTIPSYVDDGWYVGEFTVRLVDADALNKLRITLNSVDVAFGASELTTFTPSVDGAYGDGNYKFKTLPMRLGTGGLLEFELDTTQGTGSDCIIYLAEPMFHRVAEV